jgi:hypothetical protein
MRLRTKTLACGTTAVEMLMRMKILMLERLEMGQKVGQTKAQATGMDDH